MEVWSAERVYVKGRFEKDWGVAVDEDGVIQAIGPRQHLVATAKIVHHYPTHVLLPAFINPHNHGFHRFFRGLSDLSAPFGKLLHKLVYPLCQSVDNEAFDAVFRIALAEQALAGIGTVGEFHYLHNGSHRSTTKARYAERLARIAAELGMRLTLVYAFYDQGTEEKGRAFIQSLDESVREFESLVEKFRNHPLINVIPGIHGLEHSSPEAIILAAHLAQKYDCKWHMQLAERATELDTSNLHYGTTPLRALAKMEVLSDRLVVINGTVLDDEELALAAKHGVTAVVCPSATMARGDAQPNVAGLLAHEIPFSVGADSIAFSNTFAVAEDIKLLEFTERSRQNRMDVLCTDMDIDSLWDLGTWNPAQALGVNSAQFLPGCSADFMLISIAQPCARPFLPSGKNRHFMNQLLFGWSSQVQVSHLMVQGKMIVKDGHLDVDLTDSYRYLEKFREPFMQALERERLEN